MKLYVNGRSVLHQGDGNQQTSAAPDVCKTPSPGGPVPVPYPNMAKDSDLCEGSTSVEIEGHPLALKSSYLSTSSGDEAGTAGGGLISSKVHGKVIFLTASLDVLVEGQGVVRFLDAFLANANTGNTLGIVYGDPLLVPSGGEGEEPTCQACGKPLSQHEPGLQATEDVQKEMRLLVRKHHREFNQLVDDRDDKRGFMLGLLKCRSRNGKIVTISSMSGAVNSVPRSFPVGIGVDGIQFNQALKIQAERVASRRMNPIRMVRLKGEDPNSNVPGSCAAPKLLLYAMAQGWEPLEMIEQWFGPAKGDKEHGQNYKPCQTCRKLLPVLLCEARQRAKDEPIEQRE